MVFSAAVAGLLLIGITITQLGGRPAGPAAAGAAPLPAAPLPPPWAVPEPASGIRSSDPATTRPAGSPTTAERRERPAARVVATATTTVAVTRKPTSAPTQPGKTPSAELRIGEPVSLELADAPGYRVRHRDFRGRADRIGPGSSALERADARFVVRAGLADGGCVSFEASNYPGLFLRHRDFVIRLERADRTRLFAEDATFCPQTPGRAGVVALRSHNYPDRFLTENRSVLGLTPATTGTATQFVVRPPL